MLAAAALVLAAYTGTLELSDRAEMRFRHVVNDQTGVQYDILNVPSARMMITDRRWEYTLTYAPLLSLADVQKGLTPEVMNVGSATIGWHDRRVRLTLREDASYGRQNTAYLTTFSPTPGTAPPSVQGLPLVTSIGFGSSRTTLQSDVTISRRWRSTMSVGYSLFGGVDQVSRQTVPLQKGPRFDFALTYAASRTDDLVTTVDGQRTDTSIAPCPPIAVSPTATPPSTCAPQSELLVFTEGWRHKLSRLSETTLSGGASYVGVRLNPTDAHTGRPYPAVSASYAYRSALEGRRAALRLEGTIGPVIDLRTGIADYRLQGLAVGTTTRDRVTVALTGGSARSLGTILTTPATIFTVGLDVEYALTRRLSAGAGARYVWQRQEASAISPGLGTLASEYATVFLIYHPTALRF